MKVKHFCFCFDLRRGCIVYAWLQMMLVILITSKLKVIQQAIQMLHSLVFLEGLTLSMIISIEGIKGITCLPLIWGAVKENHMFYQPWLFINGLENVVLVLLTLICFIGGCFQPIVFYLLIPLIIFSAFGCYTWFCVYTVYRNDMTPSIIYFNSNHNSILLNNE